MLFNLLVSPEDAVHNMSWGDPGFGGFIILLLANVSVVSGLAIFPGLPYTVFVYAMTWGLLARLVMLGGIIMLLGCMYHFSAELLDGKGLGKYFIKALPYGFAPFCLAAPIALILKAFAGKITGWLLFLIFSVILLVWAAQLQVEIISRFYRLTGRDSLTVFVLPWIIGFLVLTGAFVFFLIGIIISAI
ncbi:MAG: YIP1 family protein [Elusimicrobiota bacterium]